MSMIWTLMLATASAASVTLNPGDDVAALTSSMGPGDEVVFNEGVYEIPTQLTWSEALGTESDPIVIRAADGAQVDLVLLEGRWHTNLENSTWVEISGITFRGGEGWEDSGGNLGGFLLENSTDITITDCVFKEMGRTAFYFYGDNARITFTGNRIHDISDYNAIYAGCSDASCWLQDSVISGNWIHDIYADNDIAVVIEAGGQGNQFSDNVIYGIGSTAVYTRSTELGEPNVIEGNAIWSVAGSAIDSRGEAIIRNNVIFNVGAYGIYSRNPAGDQVISHNTISGTGDYGIYLREWATKPGLVLANNAVSNPTGYAFYVADGDFDDDNYISSNVFTGLVQGLDELAGHFTPGHGDQDFDDPENWDFYPSPDSALVDAGDSSGEAWVPALDFNGAERTSDHVDVGAYAWSGEGNPGWALQEGYKELGIEDDGLSGEVSGGCCGKDGSEEAALLFFPALLFGAVRRRRRGR